MEVAAAKADATLSKLDLVSPRLAAALSHPTRVGVMSALIEGPASPRQLAAEMGEPLSNVTYHVNQLRELGCIELDRTEPRAGGRVLERFYRTSRRAYFDDQAWQELQDGERLGVTLTVMRMIGKDIADAMAAGTFFEDFDTRVSRSPMIVDEEGWREIAEVLDRATKGLFAVEERVAERSAASGTEPTLHTKVEMMQFRSPAPADEPV